MAAAVLAGAFSACSGSSGYHPRIDAFAFSTSVDNPHFPLVPGTRTTFDVTSDEGPQHIVVSVLRNTKMVMGVRCVVVRDTASQGDVILEDTYDWYAQDRDGNVWYFGEDTKTFKNGTLDSTEGSFDAGVHGAKPGIVMESHPKAGDSYRQEYFRGHAEDRAEVLSVNERATVPVGAFTDVLVTKDYSRLDAATEDKYYVKGVGDVLEVDVKGGTERVELLKVEPPI